MLTQARKEKATLSVKVSLHFPFSRLETGQHSQSILPHLIFSQPFKGGSFVNEMKCK